MIHSMVLTRSGLFWDVYRAFEPGIDRFARVWLQDYAVFHGLDPKLLRDSKTVMFDNALIELRRAARDLVPAPSGQTPKRRKTSEPTLPLPPDEVREERLMAAINALSTYNLSSSRLDRSHHRDLRHVACAVYVRMARYYDTHRKTGIVASLFGGGDGNALHHVCLGRILCARAPRGLRIPSGPHPYLPLPKRLLGMHAYPR